MASLQPPENGLDVALVAECFLGESREARLLERLKEAKAAGAKLAVLPELPLDPWLACKKAEAWTNFEAPGGKKHQVLSGVARDAEIAVLGGAIVAPTEGAAPRNRALLYDDKGRLLFFYDKIHIPNEPGFWEQTYYGPGSGPLAPVEFRDFSLGVQICSDIMRPIASHALALLGAEVLLVPRATAESTFSRWLRVLRATALTASVWVVSVNRPKDPDEQSIGGPSVVISPTGEAVLQSDEALSYSRLTREQLVAARRGYPGYLSDELNIYIEALVNQHSRRSSREDDQ